MLVGQIPSPKAMLTLTPNGMPAIFPHVYSCSSSHPLKITCSLRKRSAVW